MVRVVLYASIYSRVHLVKPFKPIKAYAQSNAFPDGKPGRARDKSLSYRLNALCCFLIRVPTVCLTLTGGGSLIARDFGPLLR